MLTRAIWGAGLAVFLCYGQSFEVASIKPTPPPDGTPRRLGPRGGPGTRDPGLFTCDNCALSSLVMQAYTIKPYQAVGLGGLERERFNIAAKIPEGISTEEFHLMQRNLLAERFGLKAHFEKKEIQVYELVVGKSGPKMKESVENPASPDAAPAPPAGIRSFTGRGQARMQATQETMELFAGWLSTQVDKPVIDATGLKGKFDFALSFVSERRVPNKGGGASPLASTPEIESGLTIFGAIQQLGLKLEQKKSPVDMLVIDHIEKVPTEN